MLSKSPSIFQIIRILWYWSEIALDVITKRISVWFDVCDWYCTVNINKNIHTLNHRIAQRKIKMSIRLEIVSFNILCFNKRFRDTLINMAFLGVEKFLPKTVVFNTSTQFRHHVWIFLTIFFPRIQIYKRETEMLLAGFASG